MLPVVLDICIRDHISISLMLNSIVQQIEILFPNDSDQMWLYLAINLTLISLYYQVGHETDVVIGLRIFFLDWT